MSKEKKKKKKSPQRVVEDLLNHHPLASEAEFTNREVGWLNFNRRVLHEAGDPRNPLLERLKFLGIANSNLDEFFMKRVGGLKRQVELGLATKSSDGKTPKRLLVEIRKLVVDMQADQARIYREEIFPELKKKNIFLLSWDQCDAEDHEWLRNYFKTNVFPILTPLSVDPGHPFPFISNLSVSLGVTLSHNDRDERLFARVKIPQALPQWIRLESEIGEFRFISLYELIKENLASLFPQMKVLGVMPFRLTRNADITRDEEDAEDLMEMVEEELRLRRFADVVRLEHGPNPDPWMLRFLMDELELEMQDVYELRDELDYASLDRVWDLRLPALRYPPWAPVVPAALQLDEPTQIFQVIRTTDQLVHHPYESFSASAERFIRAAAEDPKVLAIKMTLYRTGDRSAFIKAMIRAAEAGKQVVCLVELKARFDEKRNIYWAGELENAGVHVVYGIVGLKTHAKTALVVRQDPDRIRCYAHIGTGNYNSSTARFYTDFGLLTSDERITSELVEFFHYLTGRSLKSDYNHLLIAPINMFAKFKKMIEREQDHAKQGRPAQIIAKMNNMEENDLSMLLYNASQAGVNIELMVRGFCCLRPGVEGLSERIRVTSTIGRFLEHSRIFYFRNGKEDPLDGDFYLGSADWMYRNLHGRVECITPVYDRTAREKLWEVLRLHQEDKRQTWEMKSDGSYRPREDKKAMEKTENVDLGIHKKLMRIAKSRGSVVEDS